MTGQNYGNSPGGASVPPTSSQAVNNHHLAEAQQARKELFDLVDSFDSEQSLADSVETLLANAYDALLYGAKLDAEREWDALNPVNLREVNLDELHRVFSLVNFLCRLNRGYNRVLHLEGGKEK